MNVDQHRSGHERTRAQQIRQALWSGLRCRCPHCHRGPLFVKRYTLHERCPRCDYPITSALDDLVILTYIGSASITGLFALTAFVIRPPKSGVELLAYVLLALGILFGTLPHRKGLAIGLLYVHNLFFGDDVEAIESDEDDPGNR